MTTARSNPVSRKPRTDALRNHERILEAAKEAFTRSGEDASLDDIAKEAGVGAGTLYRHFPTRDALIEAVYRTEVEKLAAAEKKFSESLSPIEALRAWMLLFVDYIATKHIIAPALNTLVGGPSKLYEGSRGQIQGAIDSLVKRAIKSGDIRRDLEPFDLLRALIGVSNAASSPDWQQSARRLVDILITGSRPSNSAEKQDLWENETSSAPSLIPPDDPKRSLTVAQPDNLPHIGLVGDTYTITVTGEQTAGRFCVIDMHIPPGGGPPPHRHDFEETFILLEGQMEATFRGTKSTLRAGETLNIPANAPHQFHNVSSEAVRMLCICSPAGQEKFFAEVGVPVATRTTPPPKLNENEQAAFIEKVRAIAPKYRTELPREA